MNDMDGTERVIAPFNGAAVPVDHRKKRGPRMDKLAHVRRALGRAYRALEMWDPPDLKPVEKISRARALGFLLAELANVMKGDDLERRLAQLEDLARARLGH